MRDRISIARVLFACVAVGLVPRVAAGQQLTEAEVVSRALSESARVRAIRARSAEVGAEQLLRRVPPNPVVSFQQEHAGGATDRFLLIEHELATSGRFGLFREAGQAAVMAAELRASRSEFEIKQDARGAFAEMLAAQTRVAEVSKTVATLTELSRRLSEREAAGDGSRFDRLRAEREVAELRAEHGLAEAAVAAARARLAGLLGMSGTAPLVAAGTVASVSAMPTLEVVLTIARTRRADLVAFDSELRRFELERQAASRLGRPQPIVGGGWKQTSVENAGRSSGYAFTVGLSLPLFNRGQAEAALANAGLATARAERDALGIEIEQQVRGAYARASQLQTLIANYNRDALDVSRELIRIATLAYDEGELGILELLDAHRSLITAELRAIDLRTAARLASIELERAIGEEVVR
jgi:cobalt-zinc-cadmium efflux system outer membrane protein